MHLSSSKCFLFFTLSLVSTLFWVSNQRKKWTLGGIFKFHTAGVCTSYTPLKLTILYTDCEECSPFELKVHTISSWSLLRVIVEASCTISSQVLRSVMKREFR
jgi:hypothetical protein